MSTSGYYVGLSSTYYGNDRWTGVEHAEGHGNDCSCWATDRRLPAASPYPETGVCLRLHATTCDGPACRASYPEGSMSAGPGVDLQ